MTEEERLEAEIEADRLRDEQEYARRAKDAEAYAEILRKRERIKSDFQTFLAQTKIAYAAEDRAKAATTTEEERNVALREKEAAEAIAREHDRNRQCISCLKWVDTPPGAVWHNYVCTDPICVRDVERQKTHPIKVVRLPCGGYGELEEWLKEQYEHYTSSSTSRYPVGWEDDDA